MSIVHKGSLLIISLPDWIWAVLIVLFVVALFLMFTRRGGRY